MTLKQRVILYFYLNGKARKDLLNKSQSHLKQKPELIESWRQYYIRVYGEIPDFAKHKLNGYYRNLDEPKQKNDIAEIIKKEEQKYIKLYERNKTLILKKYNDVGKIDGATLAMLHHTFGCDPTVIEDVLNVTLPEQLHLDYLKEYEKHKRTGKQL